MHGSFWVMVLYAKSNRDSYLSRSLDLVSPPVDVVNLLKVVSVFPNVVEVTGWGVVDGVVVCFSQLNSEAQNVRALQHGSRRGLQRLTFIAETYSVQGTTFMDCNLCFNWILSAISFVLPATRRAKKEAAHPDP